MTRRPPLRLVVAGVALLATALLALLVSRSLGSGAIYYYTPGEVMATRDKPAGVIRVGGTVAPGTVNFDTRRGVLTFMLAGDGARLAVVAQSTPPRLFAAGRDALVEGRIERGALRTSDVIVKHDENYSAEKEGSR